MQELISFIASVINKGLFISFFISVLYAIRFIFFFIRDVWMHKDAQPIKFKLKEIQYLAVALAIILTSIFNGIKL